MWFTLKGTVVIESDMGILEQTRTQIKALSTASITTAFLNEAGREGLFVWSLGNYSSLVALDTLEGIYIKSTATSAATGCWVRAFDHDAIHAIWFGMTAGTNSAPVKTANTAAIQQAIDVCLLLAAQAVQLPAGTYNCDAGIYLDAPVNIRAGNISPTSAFSAKLRGVGIGNNEGRGTTLSFPTGGNQEGIIVGRGRGMEVSDLCVKGQGGYTSRAAMPSGGIGIAIAAFGSHYSLRNVMVIDWRTGIKTGYDGNNLTDSHNYVGCYITQCYIGLHVAEDQNFIVALDSCTFGDNTVHVKSTEGPLININNGNYSTASSNRVKLTIGSVSALTVAGSNWTFDCTLSGANQPMTDGALDVFCVSLPGFGVVPLTLVAYNSGTRVATLRFQTAWLTTWFASVNIKTATDIEAEIQATTTLYAAEQITMFWGPSFNINGIHVENSGCVTRFLYTTETFVGGNTTHVRNAYFNYSISHDGDKAASNNEEAKFKNQQVWPFIEIDVVANVTFEGGMFYGSGMNRFTGESICIHAKTNARLQFRDGVDLYNMNILDMPTNFINQGNDLGSMGWGFGEYDYGPFIPRGGAAGYVSNSKFNRVPFRGYYPAPECVAWMHAAQFATYLTSLGSIGTAYMPLYGSTPYKVTDADQAFMANPIVRSAHVGASWGQNITVNYSHKGRSNTLFLADTSAFFAGLRFTLPDTGQGAVGTYLCTGVYPALGYITCMRTPPSASGNGFNSAMPGTQTVTYTGTVITQDAYDFKGAATARMCATGNVPAQSGTAGTDTTPVVTEAYSAEVHVPGIMAVTGIALLNGSAVAGNVTAFLCDRSGNVVASSASTAASGTNAYQQIPFSAVYLAQGPSTFYAVLQCNNTGNRFRSHIIGTFGANKRTGLTYGTLSNNAGNAPTAFVTNLGPIANLY